MPPRLLEDRVGAILEALSEPFVPWVVGMRPGRPLMREQSPGATPEGQEHWRRARDRLDAGYRELLAALQARSEDIVADLPDRLPPTIAMTWFELPYYYAGVPSTKVSLTLQLVGARAEQFSEAEEKDVPVFPDPGGRDAVAFQVLAPGGWWPSVVGTLRPAPLPEDERSPEYGSALMAYVERTVAYLTGHTEMMITPLATQLQEFRGE